MNNIKYQIANIKNKQKANTSFAPANETTYMSFPQKRESISSEDHGFQPWVKLLIHNREAKKERTTGYARGNLYQ